MGSKRKNAGKTAGGGRAAASTAAAKAARSAGGGDAIGAMTGPERAVWYALHVLVFLVPLAMSNLGFLSNGILPLSYDQFDIAKVWVQRACTLVALAAYAWHIFVKGGKLRRNGLEWLVLVFLAWVALTTVLSIHPPTAFWGKYRRFEGMLSFINYAAVFFLVTQLVDRPSRMRSIARTLVVSGVLVAGYGLSQYLGHDPVRWGGLPFETKRSFSTYGNPDLLGGFLMFPLPLSVALALSERVEWKRMAYWLAVLPLSAVWITAFVRGAWIGGVAALLVLAFAAWRGRVRFQRPDVLFAVITALCVIAVVFASSSNPNPVMNVFERVKSIFAFGSGSAKTRFEIWEAAITAVKDRPLFGFGADTFRLVFPKYKPYEYVADAGYLSVADNVHNYPLQIASALGIPGFLLLYSVFGYALWRSRKDAFAADVDGPRYLLTGFWAAALGYVVHLFFGLSVTGSTILLWISMAVILTPFARTVDVRPPAWGAAAAAVVSVLAALGFVGNINYVLADRHHMMSRIGPVSAEERVAHAHKAIELNPWNDMYRSEIGLQYRELMISYVMRSRQQTGQDQTQGVQQAFAAFKEAEKWMLGAMEFAPPEYDNYVFLANLYNQGSQYFDPSYAGKGLEVALKGIEVEPYGPAIRFQAAISYRELRQDDKALEHLRIAAKMDPNFIDGHLLLGEMLDQRGDAEGALWAYRRVLTSLPGNAEAQSAAARLESSLATQ